MTGYTTWCMTAGKDSLFSAARPANTWTAQENDIASSCAIFLTTELSFTWSVWVARTVMEPVAKNSRHTCLLKLKMAWQALRGGKTSHSDSMLSKSNGLEISLRYHTLHTFSGGFTIGWPALQEKALANSGMFTTTPLMRYFDGECGSVSARSRISSGRVLEQSHCAKPIKKR